MTLTVRYNDRNPKLPMICSPFPILFFESFPIPLNFLYILCFFLPLPKPLRALLLILLAFCSAPLRHLERLRPGTLPDPLSRTNRSFLLFATPGVPYSPPEKILANPVYLASSFYLRHPYPSFFPEPPPFFFKTKL